MQLSPGQVAQWLEHVLYTRRLQVRSPVEAHTGGGQWMFLSHIDVSLSLSHSLSPPLQSLKSINIFKNAVEIYDLEILSQSEDDVNRKRGK